MPSASVSIGLHNVMGCTLKLLSRTKGPGEKSARWRSRLHTLQRNKIKVDFLTDNNVDRRGSRDRTRGSRRREDLSRRICTHERRRIENYEGHARRDWPPSLSSTATDVDVFVGPNSGPSSSVAMPFGPRRGESLSYLVILWIGARRMPGIKIVRGPGKKVRAVVWVDFYGGWLRDL